MLFPSFQHRSVKLSAIVVAIILLFVAGIILTTICGPERVLVAGTTGYTITGKFAVRGTPKIPKKFARAVKSRSKAITLWGSWVGAAQNTGTLISPAFQAPPILGAFAAGWGSLPGNYLAVQRVDSGEQLQLKLGNVGERWKELHWIMPRTWHGQRIQLIAVDANQDVVGWLGISSPLQISFLHFLSSQFSSLGLFPLCLISFVGFILPGLLIANLLIHRYRLSMAFTLILAIAVSVFISYLAFWVYFFNPNLGIVFSAIVLLTSMLSLVTLHRRQLLMPLLKSPDFIWSSSLMFAVSLAYIATLYLVDPGISPEILAQTRFLEGFPPDNILPKLFADKLFHGKDPRPLLNDWLSSDRPPLQTGIFLLQYPLNQIIKLSSGWHYQVVGTIIQCSWVAAVWALCRTMRLLGSQIAIVLSFAIFSGFFLFNSIYVWPKLLAGSLVILGFTLLVRSLYEYRRPYTWEITLATGAIALGMLAHTGVIFTLPAMLLMILRPQGLPSFRQTVIGVVILGLLLIPWSCYQKFYEPPADRLAKWHIAGVTEPDSRSFSQALWDSYRHLSPSQIVSNKWDNLKLLVVTPANANDLTTILGIKPESSVEKRLKEFTHVFRGLGVLNFGWLVLLIAILLKMQKKLIEMNVVKPILSVSLLSLLVWVLVSFGPATTSIHQGSYTTMILLFVGLAGVLAISLPPWICYILLSAQTFAFIIDWLIATSISFTGYLIVAPNIFMMALIILSLFVMVRIFQIVALKEHQFNY